MNLDGLRVLIVDDDAAGRFSLEKAVLGWNMIPTTADSSRSALDEVARAARSGEPFDLMLLDAHMPGMDGSMMAERIKAMLPASNVPIIMLSSAPARDEDAAYKTAGMTACLAKPVRPSELLAEIRRALGAAPRLDTSDVPQPTAAGGRGIDVLLVEDSAVNQKVVTLILEKRGHRVHLAKNGKIALEMMAAGRFDIVLMDVEMPEMNGYDTTAAIRERERATGGHVPIIALTAYALTGDRERCLAAGMDVYISKPLRSQELLRAIESLVPVGTPAQSGPADLDGGLG